MFKVSLQTIEDLLNNNFGNIQNKTRFKNWDILNSICWSIGSITNQIPDKQSKEFLVKAIQGKYVCKNSD